MSKEKGMNSRNSGHKQSLRFNEGNKSAPAKNTPIMTSAGHYQQIEESSLDDHAALLLKIEQLEDDLARRQESYVTRERAYKGKIEELEDELMQQRQEKTGWMQKDDRITYLKSVHGKILGSVELVQDRTAKILQEQERDLLRAFRARLFDVQTELEKEKSKKDDGATAWIEKSRALEGEKEWAKEVADRLERTNQALKQENERLKAQFVSQEEDRGFMVQQLIMVKKDNTSLRAEFEKQGEECDKLSTRVAELESGASGQLGFIRSDGERESEEKLKAANVRLRRLIAEERKSLKIARENYASELRARTEMELLLRQCVADVRKEIAKRNIASAQAQQQLYGRAPGLIPVDEFTKEDRERALELLLAQERVVSLLYAKTFPLPTHQQPSTQDIDQRQSRDTRSKGVLNALTDNDLEYGSYSVADSHAGGDHLDTIGSPPATNQSSKEAGDVKLPQI
jgi:hypothetical protein